MRNFKHQFGMFSKLFDMQLIMISNYLNVQITHSVTAKILTVSCGHKVQKYVSLGFNSKTIKSSSLAGRPNYFSQFNSINKQNRLPNENEFYIVERKSEFSNDWDVDIMEKITQK